MKNIKTKLKDLATNNYLGLHKWLDSKEIEQKILWGILFCFLLVYTVLFSNHLFQLLHILNTARKEILELKGSKEIGTIFLLILLFGLASLCNSYRKEIKNIKTKYKTDDKINKFQERRMEFVNELLKQLTKTNEINEYFYKEDFLKETNFNDGEFNLYKWASGYKFCSPNSDSSGKERHKINTEQCVKAYEQNKQSEHLKMSSKLDDKLFRITVLMALIAFVQMFIAFLQFFDKQ